jgi:transposase-like protein
VSELAAYNSEGRRIGSAHPRARASDTIVRAALALFDQGIGYRRIARRLGLSPNTVKNWCRGVSRCQIPIAWRPVPSSEVSG